MNNLIFASYKPGALADVVRLHMAYYQPNWGFGLAFETKVAAELSEFLGRYKAGIDLFITVYSSTGECIGSISLDCKDATGMGAHIRWFIVDARYAGKGIGRSLMQKVIDHCNRSNFSRSYLTTFEGLHAARKLYEAFDYRLTEELDVDQWQSGVKEQIFVRDMST